MVLLIKHLFKFFVYMFKLKDYFIPLRAFILSRIQIDPIFVQNNLIQFNLKNNIL